MKTAKEMQIAIGQECELLTAEKLRVGVKIIDVRNAWNRIDCLIEPLQGSGQAWVSSERLRKSEDWVCCNCGGKHKHSDACCDRIPERI